MKEAFIAAAIGGLLAVDGRSSMRFMVSQPIVGGLLVGLAVGAPREGFIAGSLMQMLFLGFVSVRGRRLPDLPMAGATAAAIYALAPRYPDAPAEGTILFTALAVGIGAAWLGYVFYRGVRRVMVTVAATAMRLYLGGKRSAAAALHLAPLTLHFLYGFAVVLVATLLGRLIAGRATVAVDAWEQLAVLLPAIGVGGLMRLHLVKTRVFWFGAGFLLSFLFLTMGGS